MELKLALARSCGVTDILVSVEPSVSVGVLAERIVAVDPDAEAQPVGPVTLSVATPAGWRSLDPAAEISEVGLSSGLTTAVVPTGDASGAASVVGDDPVVAVAEVLAGPDGGREFPLRAGEWLIGRDSAADIRLTDPYVSKRHAVVRIGRDVRLIDQNSANGTSVNGVTPAAARLTGQTAVTLGDTTLHVRLLRPETGEAAGDGGQPVVEFNRSPRVEPRFRPLEEEIAEPPQRPPGQPFPFLSILIPVALGLLLWLVTGSGLLALFLALGSMLLIGSMLEQNLFGRRSHKRARAAYRAALRAQRERFAQAREAEGQARRLEHPSVAEIRTAVVERTPMLWSRRRHQLLFGQVRLGTATRPSLSQLDAPAQRGDPDLLAEANAAVDEFRDVPDVPVVVDLDDVGALGVAGPAQRRADVSRGVVLQLLALHSPEDLVVAALVPPNMKADWGWLRCSGLRTVVALRTSVSREAPPKSASIDSPRVVSRTLDGLTSRWTNPAACK